MLETKTLFVGHGKKHKPITYPLPDENTKRIYLDINPNSDPDIVGDFTKLKLVKSLDMFGYDYVVFSNPPYSLLPIFIRHARLLLKPNGLLIISGFGGFVLKTKNMERDIFNFVKPLGAINGYGWYYVIQYQKILLVVYQSTPFLDDNMKKGLLLNEGRLKLNFDYTLPKINDYVDWECINNNNKTLSDMVFRNRIKLSWKKYDYIYGNINFVNYISLLIHLNLNGTIRIVDGLNTIQHRPENIPQYLLPTTLEEYKKIVWVDDYMKVNDFQDLFKYFNEKGYITLNFKKNDVIIKRIKEAPQDKIM